MDKMKKVCCAGVLVIVVFGGWMTAEGGTPIPGMVSYWTFDEVEGEVSHDSFGNNDGVVHNAEWTAGQIGGALDFDETGRVNCGHDSSLDMTDGTTICAWVRPDPNITVGYRHFIARGYYGSSSNNANLKLAYRAETGEFHYRIKYNLHERTIMAPAVGAGVWQHIAATYDDSGTMELYVNGEFAGQETGADLRPIVSQFDLLIGTELGGYQQPEVCFDGMIDDVAIFSRTLTEDKIQQSYQDGLEGFGYELDQRQVAINKVEWAIATKTEAIELVDLAMERERAAYSALDELRDSGELGELSAMDVFKARLEILWAMGRQINAKFKLRLSINRLERALRRLTLEPEPEEGPVRPERQLTLRRRLGR
jgi:hypothetical protein